LYGHWVHGVFEVSLLGCAGIRQILAEFGEHLLAALEHHALAPDMADISVQHGLDCDFSRHTGCSTMALP
jgi:hypothetical protein